MIQTLISPTQADNHIPEYIDIHHWEEWKKSAVSDVIIKLVLKSVHDSREVDKILNRNNRRRWKHSNELVPAWCVTGVSPLTGESTLEGVQVKPDTPRIGEDGKPLKYEGAKDYDTAPLFLNTGIEDYWLNIYQDILQPIIITEGAKKAGAGLSIGLPTISLPGVSTCRKKGRLHRNLELFAKLGRTFYVCFDNDILHKRPVQDGLLGLARELAAKGSKVMVMQLPDGDAKGMDDYIALHGEDAFKELVTNALTFEEWKEESSKKLEELEEVFKSRMASRFNLVNKVWGDSLRYNTLKKAIEYHGAPLDMNHIKLILALEFDVDIAKDDAFTIIERIAKANSYSPVVEYLDDVEQKFPDITGDYLDNLAYEFFGTTDPLHTTYFKNFLVASVARARHPGCWMDCALILYGDQGIRKSTFWRTLYGEDCFSDDLGNDNDKDEKMKMHRFWCLEWGEFETVYKRKDVEELKRFLAKKEETFRTPYDRVPIDYKRGFVFVGTTNQTEILNDPSGDRRFWIIPVSKAKIPVETVQVYRDKIWAAANALFKSGYPYMLTDEQEAQRADRNREFQVIDPWMEVIEEFIGVKHFVTTQSLYNLLSIDLSHQDISSNKRISGIMRRLGWEHGREYGKRGARGWVCKTEKNNSVKNDFALDHLGSFGSASPETAVQQEIQSDPREEVKSDPREVFSLPLGSLPLDQKNPPIARVSEDVIQVIQGDPRENQLFVENSKKTQQRIEDDVPQKTNSVPTKVEVGKVYWCDRLKSKVKVSKIIKSKSEAEVLLPYPLDQDRVKLSELSELPETHILPPMPKFRVGQSVLVLKGQHQGQTLLISSISEDGDIWLRSSFKPGAPPLGNKGKGYQPDQLKAL
ncbi:VapE domain-containing protein [Calothrix sp. PCC 7507]|uniref:VapE domain-containing protein n=1 Tax=Calothrix sp. PCC 7507 TaxID=99598 RepID=UPI00029F4D74|nr:VapE domain-containing protein [Calothrix sp. PCC 7507]AFY31611.1 virulence-associated E family protein [Calothrix sp. PCC 7507]